MGIYGMVLGFLKLGFLLDFVSTPVLNGFISAAAIVIGLGQVDNLLGESNVRDGTAHIIHDVLSFLPQANGFACGIGFGSMALLVILQQVGKRWGKTNKFAFYFSITRAFITLLLFTGISYAVNKKFSSDDDYLFEVAEVEKTEIYPEVTSSALFSKAFGRSIAPFVAAGLEHVAIARAFGIRNNYVMDTSQELCYLGLVNFVNSFFHSMGVGGAMSRTAVNSDCKVRSPLSGFITTAAVLISIYFLSGALYWIPKATLAAIVITAIWPLIGTWRTYYHYWRTSFTDFVAAMAAFWITLFVASEYGIGSAVAWMIAQSLIRQAFTKVNQIGSDSPSELQRSLDDARGMPASIPADTRVFKFTQNLFFPNAQRAKMAIMDTIQTHHAPTYSNANGAEADRNWSVVGEKRLKKLRKAAGVHDAGDLPPIRIVILDFHKVHHLDVTANTKLHEFFNELRRYAGERVEVRFIGLAPHVRERLERCRPGWILIDREPGTTPETEKDKKRQGDEEVRVFRTVGDAVAAIRYGEVEQIMEEKMEMGASHKETV
jgi:sodium-independent sulfate anion transporter 11